jgi:hypothetical protein
VLLLGQRRLDTGEELTDARHGVLHLEL